jgi:ATP-binding cassette subfamily D (ALD) protein 3
MNELSHRALELIYYLTENRTRKISTVLVCSVSFYILGKFMKSSELKIDISDTLVKKDDKKTKGNVDKNFLKNLSRLIKICIPKLLGRENLSMGVLVVSLVGRTFLSIYMAEITSNIVKNIVKKDLTEFLTNIVILGGLSLPGAAINSMIDYMQKELSLYFRENLCNDFQDKMLENMSYYKITNLDSRIKNPDQIFTSDIEKFSSSLASLFVNFTKPLLDIVLFIKKLAETIGYSGPGMLVGWFVVSGLLMKVITPSFGKLAAIQQCKCFCIFFLLIFNFYTINH